MVKHIVMWKLKEYACGNTKEKNAQIIKEKLTDKERGFVYIARKVDTYIADKINSYGFCIIFSYHFFKE